MKSLKSFLNIILHPSKVIIKVLNLNLIKMNDLTYIKLIYYFTFHKKIDLDNPKSLNEKFNWLKLYDQNDDYSNLVDKIKVKEIVASIIGKEYIIPTLGVYDSTKNIDIKNLPNQFVIKCNHDSGSIFICNNFDKVHIKKIFKKLDVALKKNYFYKWREWPYKNVPPKIIIERFMGDNLVDYKLQCFDGKVDNILVCEGRNSKRGVRYHYFDRNWNYLNYCPYDDVNPNVFLLLKPDNLNEMIDLAEKISKGYKELRVDFYNINGKVYFGEITFFSDAGFDTTITTEADLILGSKLKIGKENHNED